MLTKGAIGNLINRYRAVLKKCHLLNTFGSLAVASMLVMGGAGVAEADVKYFGKAVDDASTETVYKQLLESAPTCNTPSENLNDVSGINNDVKVAAGITSVTSKGNEWVWDGLNSGYKTKYEINTTSVNAEVSQDSTLKANSITIEGSGTKTANLNNYGTTNVKDKITITKGGTFSNTGLVSRDSSSDALTVDIASGGSYYNNAGTTTIDILNGGTKVLGYYTSAGGTLGVSGGDVIAKSSDAWLSSLTMENAGKLYVGYEKVTGADGKVEYKKVNVADEEDHNTLKLDSVNFDNAISAVVKTHDTQVALGGVENLWDSDPTYAIKNTDISVSSNTGVSINNLISNLGNVDWSNVDWSNFTSSLGELLTADGLLSWGDTSLNNTSVTADNALAGFVGDVTLDKDSSLTAKNGAVAAVLLGGLTSNGGDITIEKGTETDKASTLAVTGNTSLKNGATLGVENSLAILTGGTSLDASSISVKGDEVSLKFDELDKLDFSDPQTFAKILNSSILASLGGTELKNESSVTVDKGVAVFTGKDAVPGLKMDGTSNLTAQDGALVGVIGDLASTGGDITVTDELSAAVLDADDKDGALSTLLVTGRTDLTDGANLNVKNSLAILTGGTSLDASSISVKGDEVSLKFDELDKLDFSDPQTFAKILNSSILASLGGTELKNESSVTVDKGVAVFTGKDAVPGLNLNDSSLTAQDGALVGVIGDLASTGGDITVTDEPSAAVLDADDKDGALSTLLVTGRTDLTDGANLNVKNSLAILTGGTSLDGSSISVKGDANSLDFSELDNLDFSKPETLTKALNSSILAALNGTELKNDSSVTVDKGIAVFTGKTEKVEQTDANGNKTEVEVVTPGLNLNGSSFTAQNGALVGVFNGLTSTNSDISVTNKDENGTAGSKSTLFVSGDTSMTGRKLDVADSLAILTGNASMAGTKVSVMGTDSIGINTDNVGGAFSNGLDPNALLGLFNGATLGVFGENGMTMTGNSSLEAENAIAIVTGDLTANFDAKTADPNLSVNKSLLYVGEDTALTNATAKVDSSVVALGGNAIAGGLSKIFDKAQGLTDGKVDLSKIDAETINGLLYAVATNNSTTLNNSSLDVDKSLVAAVGKLTADNGSAIDLASSGLLLGGDAELNGAALKLDKSAFAMGGGLTIDNGTTDGEGSAVTASNSGLVVGDQLNATNRDASFSNSLLYVGDATTLNNSDLTLNSSVAVLGGDVVADTAAAAAFKVMNKMAQVDFANLTDPEYVKEALKIYGDLALDKLTDLKPEDVAAYLAAHKSDTTLTDSALTLNKADGAALGSTAVVFGDLTMKGASSADLTGSSLLVLDDIHAGNSGLTAKNGSLVAMTGDLTAAAGNAITVTDKSGLVVGDNFKVTGRDGSKVEKSALYVGDNTTLTNAPLTLSSSVAVLGGDMATDALAGLALDVIKNNDLTVEKLSNLTAQQAFSNIAEAFEGKLDNKTPEQIAKYISDNTRDTTLTGSALTLNKAKGEALGSTVAAFGNLTATDSNVGVQGSNLLVLGDTTLDNASALSVTDKSVMAMGGSLTVGSAATTFAARTAPAPLTVTDSVLAVGDILDVTGRAVNVSKSALYVGDQTNLTNAPLTMTDSVAVLGGDVLADPVLGSMWTSVQDADLSKVELSSDIVERGFKKILKDIDDKLDTVDGQDVIDYLAANMRDVTLNGSDVTAANSAIAAFGNLTTQGDNAVDLTGSSLFVLGKTDINGTSSLSAKDGSMVAVGESLNVASGGSVTTDEAMLFVGNNTTFNGAKLDADKTVAILGGGEIAETFADTVYDALKGVKGYLDATGTDASTLTVDTLKAILVQNLPSKAELKDIVTKGGTSNFTRAVADVDNSLVAVMGTLESDNSNIDLDTSGLFVGGALNSKGSTLTTEKSAVLVSQNTNLTNTQAMVNNSAVVLGGGNIIESLADLVVRDGEGNISLDTSSIKEDGMKAAIVAALKGSAGTELTAGANIKAAGSLVAVAGNLDVNNGSGLGAQTSTLLVGGNTKFSGNSVFDASEASFVAMAGGLTAENSDIHTNSASLFVGNDTELKHSTMELNSTAAVLGGGEVLEQLASLIYSAAKDTDGGLKAILDDPSKLSVDSLKALGQKYFNLDAFKAAALGGGKTTLTEGSQLNADGGSAVAVMGGLSVDGNSSVCIRGGSSLGVTKGLDLDGTLTVGKASVLLNGGLTGEGNISNMGLFTATGGSVAGFTGDFTQTDGIATINATDSFFGGDVAINGGILVADADTVLKHGIEYKTLADGSIVANVITDKLQTQAGAIVNLDCEGREYTRTQYTIAKNELADQQGGGTLVFINGKLITDEGERILAGGTIDSNSLTIAGNGNTVLVGEGLSVTDALKAGYGYNAVSDKMLYLVAKNDASQQLRDFGTVNLDGTEFIAQGLVVGDVDKLKLTGKANVTLTGTGAALIGSSSKDAEGVESVTPIVADVTIDSGSTLNIGTPGLEGPINGEFGTVNVAGAHNLYGNGEATTEIKYGSLIVGDASNTKAVVGLANADITIDNALKSFGTLDIKNSTVTAGGIETSGTFTATNSKLNSTLNVSSGTVTLNDTIVSLLTDVTDGDLTANRATLGDLSLKAGNVELADTDVNGKASVDGGTFTANAASKLNVLNVRNSGDVTLTGTSVMGMTSVFDGTFMAQEKASLAGGLTVSGGTANVNDSIVGTKTSVFGGTINATDAKLAELTVDGGTLNAYNVTVNGNVAGSAGNITLDGGTFDVVGGTVSGFKGTYTQQDGTTTLTETNKFFGGAVNINGGTMNAHSVILNGNTVTVGDDAELIVGNQSSIDGNPYYQEGKLEFNDGHLVINGGTVIADADLVLNRDETFSLKDHMGAGIVGTDGKLKLDLAKESSGNYIAGEYNSTQFSTAKSSLFGAGEGAELIFLNSIFKPEISEDGEGGKPGSSVLIGATVNAGVATMGASSKPTLVPTGQSLENMNEGDSSDDKFYNNKVTLTAVDDPLHKPIDADEIHANGAKFEAGFLEVAARDSNDDAVKLVFDGNANVQLSGYHHPGYISDDKDHHGIVSDTNGKDLKVSFDVEKGSTFTFGHENNSVLEQAAEFVEANIRGNHTLHGGNHEEHNENDGARLTHASYEKVTVADGGQLDILNASVKVKELHANTGGRIYVDPSYLNVAELKTAMGADVIVGKGSVVELGEQGGDTLKGYMQEAGLEVLDAAEGGFTVEGCNAVLSLLNYVNPVTNDATPVTMEANGSITVDGSITAAPSTRADAVAFGTGSLLVLEGDNVPSAGAFIGTDKHSFTVSSDAKLYIANAKAGTYIIADDFGGGISLATGGWNDSNLLVNLLLDAETSATEDGEGIIVKAEQKDLTGAIPVNALEELCSTTPDINAPETGKRFLSLAVDPTVSADTAEAIKLANEVSRTALTAGVQNTALRVSDLASRTVVDHMSLSQHDGSKAIHADGVDFWAAPMYGNLFTSGMVTADSSVRGQIGGLALGMDMESQEIHGGKFRIGAALNGGGGNSDTKGNVTSVSNDYNFGGLNLYAGWTKGAFNVIGSLGYGFADHEVSMGLPSSMKMGAAKADIDTTAVTVDLRAEYQFKTNWMDVLPHAGIRYTSLQTEAHDLKVGGNVLNSVKSDTQHIVQFPIGVTLTKDFVASDWNVKPMVDLSVIPAAGDKNATTKVNFSGMDAWDSVNTRVMDSTSWSGTVGVQAEKGNFTLGLNYGVQASSHETDQNIQLKLGWKF